MGKTKKTESKFATWLKNLQEKRRVVVLDEGSFEEKRNFTTSKFSLLVFFLFSIIVFSILCFLVISYSSIKTFVPGYPSVTAQKELIDKNIELDQKLNDLIIKTNKEEQYITNIQKILNGDTPIDRDSSEKVFKSQNINSTNELSFSEKTIREKVDKREKYDIDVIPWWCTNKRCTS
jgi:hypothetical protein